MKNYDNIPDKPEERKIIVLLKRSDIDFLRVKGVKEENKWEDKPGVTILAYNDLDDSEKLKDIYKSLKKDNLIENETVLVQDPYNIDKYHKVGNSFNPETFSLKQSENKYHIFSDFCALLGATKVSLEDCVRSSKTTELEKKLSAKGGREDIQVEGEFSVPTLIKGLIGKIKAKTVIKPNSEGTLSSKDNDEEKISLSTSMETTFSDNKKTDTDAAIKYLREKNLNPDDELFSFLIRRRKSETGKVNDYRTTFSLSSEATKILEKAASIRFPFFNCKGEFSETVKELKEVKSTVLVKFGNG